MRFTWHPGKSAENLRLRDFAFATLIFDGPTLERQDTRLDYGERRTITVGLAQGIALTVVYTDRTDATGAGTRRLISARRSNRREREAYVRALEGP